MIEKGTSKTDRKTTTWSEHVIHMTVLQDRRRPPLLGKSFKQDEVGIFRTVKIFVFHNHPCRFEERLRSSSRQLEYGRPSPSGFRSSLS